MSHQAAIRAALQSGDRLLVLFARMGSSEHPRGVVLNAYRTARHALTGHLDQVWLVEQILAELNYKIEQAIALLLAEARSAGETQAKKTLESYGLRVTTPEEIQTGVEAIRATLAAQTATIRSLVYANLPDIEAQVLGDEARMGLLSPGPVVREGARWLATATNASFWGMVAASVMQAGAQEEYQRQAIAAVDQKTTDCCLRVSGQVVGMREDFHLTGTPRYADYMHSPPFHWNCRTSVALVYISERNDSLTQGMRKAAADELQARAVTGKRETIWPSHARSGRKNAG